MFIAAILTASLTTVLDPPVVLVGICPFGYLYMWVYLYKLPYIP